MILRKFRIKRQLKTFQETADPQILAEEKAALERENAEAPNSTTFLPTTIGAELLNKNYRDWFRPSLTLRPTDSSLTMRGDYEAGE